MTLRTAVGTTLSIALLAGSAGAITQGIADTHAGVTHHTTATPVAHYDPRIDPNAKGHPLWTKTNPTREDCGKLADMEARGEIAWEAAYDPASPCEALRRRLAKLDGIVP
jgi:hypothetical protein